MATIIKTLDTDYIVNVSVQPVTLELIVGPVGQTSKTILTIDGQSPKDVTSGDLPDKVVGGLDVTLIGRNSELGGRVLKIKTNISDTSKETNETELIVKVDGGKFGLKEYPMVLVVNDEGDDANYDVTINFITS